MCGLMKEASLRVEAATWQGREGSNLSEVRISRPNDRLIRVSGYLVE